MLFYFFFFFQAEDGIRDGTVTGVQTCALPISPVRGAETFFSTAHGSGRTMSRTKARKLWHGKQLQRDLEARGIYVRSTSWAGLAEEAGAAYKDIDEVIAATELAGISKPVARFTPVGNVKG